MKSCNRIFLLSLFLFASCRNEEPAEQPCDFDGLLGQNVTISATLDSETKTALDGLSVVWEEGDQVSISCIGYASLDPLNINPADIGKTTARFTGYHSTADEYAVIYAPGAYYFPAPASINLKIPSTQHYRKNSFDNGANIAIGHATDLSQPVVLKNVGGLLKLSIKGSDVIKNIELSSLAETEFLAGDAYISKSFTDESIPNFVCTDNLSSKLLLDCGSGVTLNQSGVDFYFFVPCGTLSKGFIVKINDNDGGSMVVQAPASQKNKIQRSKILEMPVITYQSGNIPTAFISKTVLGVYDKCMSEPVLESKFLSSKIQAGVTNNGTNQVFSLKNWDDEWIVEFVFPSSVVANAVYDITVNPVLGTGSGYSAQTLKLKCLMTKDGLGWFADTNSDKGYIFNIM